jgi:hypothetical protein
MANSRVNPRRIHKHLPYTVEQVADALKVHKKTVRLWIKQRGCRWPTRTAR